MAQSKIDLFNLALSFIGTKTAPIAAEDEKSIEAEDLFTVVCGCT